MTDFLESIKSDLFSRRMLPLLVLIGLALIAAAGYAVTSGSSNSTAPPPSSGASATTGAHASTLPVVVAGANPHQAASEIPAGIRYQSQGATRDPFKPLSSPPAPKSTSATGSKTSGATSSSPSSGSSGASGAGKGSEEHKSPTPTPAKPAKPTKPAKPPFPYIVSVLFGLAPGATGQPTPLTPYESLKPSTPLPSKTQARIAFERVTSSGTGAVFKLVVAPILQGPGRCLPSTSECQSIDLAVGQAEELQYVEANGQLVVYELKIVSITKRSAGANAARAKGNASTAAKHALSTAQVSKKRTPATQDATPAPA
jgi:hypothetical protein